MTYTDISLDQSLGEVFPFDQLPPPVLQSLAVDSQRLRYRIGQPILRRESMPHQVVVILTGQARLLGYDANKRSPMTLDLLKPKSVLGLAGLVRGVPCETAIASSEVEAITIPIGMLRQLLTTNERFAQAVTDYCYLAEVFDLVSQYFQVQARSVDDLAETAHRLQAGAIARTLRAGPVTIDSASPSQLWFVSSQSIAQYPAGSWLLQEMLDGRITSERNTRLIGIDMRQLASQSGPRSADSNAALALSDEPRDISDLSTGVDISSSSADLITPTFVDNTSRNTPYAPELTYDSNIVEEGSDRAKALKYPVMRGREDVGTALACFAMIAQHFGMPFKRDVVERVLVNQKERLGHLSLTACGAVADLIGLKPQLAKVPASSIDRLPRLALINWRDGFAVVYETSPSEYVLGVPAENKIIRHSPEAFAEIWGPEGEVLLVETTEQTPQQKFGLSWFIPSLKKYRGTLSLVLVASLFVQLFGLANPLMVQVIIDRVIMQNSIDTLHVLGVFLVVVAVFEAILTSLRTYLFVDTTNRIDMALGAEIIDHLLRLPLRYFDRRPVGELSSRVNELENIRQFLTGTALTVVLDALFSVVYILVMFIYSIKLTFVSLATIPLFMILTFFVSPIVRRQLRAKAERNAETQSFLVEALSGVQTVKAQNMELKTRWKWQEKYARYVSDGFKTVLTSTTAGSASGFLNKLSGLLVLWFGASLVLEGNLTLGGLIAFRIISGYVTQPLLRLTQLWQNFQETALSLERLSDIIDHPQEQAEEDRAQIPMPEIQGNVKYEDLSFRFTPSGPLQLININLEFHKGEFIGIVGQSGSGKSTLMKLLPRLYNAESGRILIDNYDISKVELYSLRQQVGIVPQDSLLFEGSIQDNIALTNPQADTNSVITAAKIANAHNFIMDLPGGYNSRVGERGSSLSGGQRQRIAIARTVLQNPRLLILDEATSALDYDTEAQVCYNLKQWAQGRTVFFITHRLSTIRQADRILVMDKGSVVELGTHEELMALKGRYYCLYEQQGE
ncbi:type I secretion system permease/ATPase [cf. Phormidesmis sp. LEGE 11477]|uniref:type I secretion system permease/ATPase n=1 Tax=cf. Phormidesmis sp. LEGE 11477 TaxID=1828680 RepID=UPI001880CF45|nr:type I secretion system permease/ATPase [cf. Phormidesmis sp. LEGE 11477]MBE9059448.1 peptidase domain-containing ABC transporter [cf. Phormidesmis sp. LEGE 11477]